MPISIPKWEFPAVVIVSTNQGDSTTSDEVRTKVLETLKLVQIGQVLRNK